METYNEFDLIDFTQNNFGVIKVNNLEVTDDLGNINLKDFIICKEEKE